MAEKTWSWPGAWPERKMAQKLKNVTQKSWRHIKDNGKGSEGYLL
jgi:hypothetical protein